MGEGGKGWRGSRKGRMYAFSAEVRTKETPTAGRAVRAVPSPAYCRDSSRNKKKFVIHAAEERVRGTVVTRLIMCGRGESVEGG